MRSCCYSVLAVIIVTTSLSAGVGGDWKIVDGLMLEWGYGSRHHENGNSRAPGLVGGIEVASVAFGIRGVAPVGLGTKLLELFVAGSSGDSYGPSSFLPVYVYYPLLSSNPEPLRNSTKKFRRRFVYLFAGGSKWGMPQDYWHAGVECIVLSCRNPLPPDPGDPLSWLPDKFPSVSFGFRVGIYGSSDYKENSFSRDGDIGAYAVLTFSFGGAFQ